MASRNPRLKPLSPRLIFLTLLLSHTPLAFTQSIISSTEPLLPTKKSFFRDQPLEILTPGAGGAPPLRGSSARSDLESIAGSALAGASWEGSSSEGASSDSSSSEGASAEDASSEGAISEVAGNLPVEPAVFAETSVLDGGPARRELRGKRKVLRRRRSRKGRRASKNKKAHKKPKPEVNIAKLLWGPEGTMSALRGNPKNVDGSGSALGSAQGAMAAASTVNVGALAGGGGDFSSYVPWCGTFNRNPPRWWNTSSAYARFDAYGCSSISGIHTAQTHLKTIILIDRSDAENTYLRLPGTNKNAYGEELTPVDTNPVYPAEERALDVKSNVFCSAGQIMPDGTLLSIGGSSDATNADPLYNGSFAIRAFRPCTEKNCDFQLVGDMTWKRWYPTTQIMPDGRVLIVGGANVYGNIAINDMNKNNPTIEYWPRARNEGNYYLQFLVDTLPFNLYAFVHVLPSGLVFIFTANQYILFDSRTNQPVQGRSTPALNVGTEDRYNIPIYRQYPTAGSSAMFPLTSKNNYSAEIMICGGNNAKATMVMGSGPKSNANGRIPADYNCWRIKPEDPNPTWIKEPMCADAPTCTVPFRRVMGDMVILVDGNILIINGAQQGYQGLKQTYSNKPQLQPLIYLSQDHTWDPYWKLPTSNVPRVYHSSALLLHDATVLLSGSNPNPTLSTAGGFPTEFRMEKFIPPYLMTGQRRPVLFKAPKRVPVNRLFSIYFNANRPAARQNLTTRFKVSMLYPGFSTHNQRHGMRHIDLDIASIVVVRQVTYIARVHSPPNVNIGIPTLYWIHVLDNGVPNVEGLPVNLTRQGATDFVHF